MIKEKTARKAALTRKVLRGLSAIAAAVEAGDLLEGDLAENSDDVSRALDWIHRRIMEADKMNAMDRGICGDVEDEHFKGLHAEDLFCEADNAK